VKRVVVPELLDNDLGTREEVEGSLDDLRMFNRRFGGIHTTSEVLRRIAQNHGLKNIFWLDVAGSTGDVASLTGRSLSTYGIGSETVVLDRSSSHMNGSHMSVCGDAMMLPFADNS